MMRCLRDLGVAWDPARASSTFTALCMIHCDLAVLTWLLGPGGCPVDWAAVVREAKSYQYQMEEGLAWVKKVASANGVELPA